jgi:hypothetical protein
MLNLPNIQASPTEVLPQSDSPASPPRQNGAGGDPFDQIMRQALSHAGRDQKSGSAMLSQTDKATQSLQPDSFKGAKNMAPLPPTNPAVAPPTTIIIPKQPANPAELLPLKAFDRTTGNSQATANAPAQNDPYANVPAANPLPIESKGEEGAPTNSKGQNSGKSGASEPATTSAANVTPPAPIIGQNLPPESGSGIYTGTSLSPAPASSTCLSEASSLMAALPTRSGAASRTTAVVESKASASRAGATKSAHQQISQSNPALPAAAAASKQNSGGTGPAIAIDKFGNWIGNTPPVVAQLQNAVISHNSDRAATTAGSTSILAAGSNASASPPATSASLAVPPVVEVIQQNMGGGMGIESSHLAPNAEPPDALPPAKGKNITGTVSQVSSRVGGVPGAVPATIVGGTTAITRLTGDDPAGLNGQNFATSSTSYDPIPAAGSNPPNLPVANVPAGIHGETANTSATTLLSLPATSLPGPAILSADKNVSSTLPQAANPTPAPPKNSSEDLFAKTWGKAGMTTPPAISVVQQKTAAASGAGALASNPVAFIPNQLIPADGQNISVPAKPELSLATAKKSADSTTNEPLSAGATDSAGPAPNIGGNTTAISDGTPSALVGELMNNGGKSDNSAGLSGQLLPGSISVMAHASDSPSVVGQTAVGGTTDASNAKGSSIPEIWASTHGTASNSAVDLERTHELVATHAMRLENSGNTSLTVVIKPGGGTQMSLELRQQGNGIEAQASLQQGDYKHLSQNWPELQQRLEQRGIRLAPLTDDGSAAFSSGTGGQGSGRFGPSTPQSMEPLMSTGFGGTFTTTMTTTAPSIPMKTATGWETWA